MQALHNPVLRHEACEKRSRALEILRLDRGVDLASGLIEWILDVAARIDAGAGEVGNCQAAEIELASRKHALDRDGVRVNSARAQDVGFQRQRHLLDAAGRERLAGEELAQRARFLQVRAVRTEIDRHYVVPRLRETPDLDRAAHGADAGRGNEVREALLTRAKIDVGLDREAPDLRGRAYLAAPPAREGRGAVRRDAGVTLKRRLGVDADRSAHPDLGLAGQRRAEIVEMPGAIASRKVGADGLNHPSADHGPLRPQMQHSRDFRRRNIGNLLGERSHGGLDSNRLLRPTAERPVNVDLAGGERHIEARRRAEIDLSGRLQDERSLRPAVGNLHFAHGERHRIKREGAACPEVRPW